MFFVLINLNFMEENFPEAKKNVINYGKNSIGFVILQFICT